MIHEGRAGADMDWKKVLLLTGGAAGTAALVYCILRDDVEEKELPVEPKDRNSRSVTMTKEEALKVLDDWLASVGTMKAHMKDITQSVRKNSLSFEESYNLIKAVEPQDILEKYNLSEEDFNSTLSRYQDDPQVKNSVSKIMSPDIALAVEESKIAVDVRMLIDVHAFMLQELESILKEIEGSTQKDRYNGKSASLTAQAIVAAKVEEKFRVTSEAVERAMIRHHSALATNQEFGNISVKMQRCMSQLTLR